MTLITSHGMNSPGPHHGNNPSPSGRVTPRRYGMNGRGTERIRMATCGALVSLLLGTACQSSTAIEFPAFKRLAPSMRIPENVMRLGVVIPLTRDRELRSAYSRLEHATFQLKQERPRLQIVEFTERDTLLGEQRRQLSGSVSDNTAVHVGGLLGVDSIMMYDIVVPSSRDRLVARFYDNPIEITVTSKILRVTTGEVLYYNVVTVRQEPRSEEPFLSVSLLPLLDRGIAQMVADLQSAFH